MGDRPRITHVAVAHPPERVRQSDVPGLMGARGLRSVRARALARGSRIQERRLALPPDGIRDLTTIEQRNAVYRDRAPGLAAEAVSGVLEASCQPRVGAIVTSSCTGYSVPSLAASVVTSTGLAPSTARIPLTEAGCAGGVVALATAAGFVATHAASAAIACAVELCSLSFHHSDDEGVLTADLIFGDGAGAAIVTGAGEGLEIVDGASLLLPGTAHLLGFDLTDQGFMPVLSRSLVEVVADGITCALAPLLHRNGLDCHNIDAWLLHPGGSRILERLERRLGTTRDATKWSWASLREFGNTSSASIFDVLRRYLEDRRPPEWGIVAAFGPGVAVELLLVRRDC